MVTFIQIAFAKYSLSNYVRLFCCVLVSLFAVCVCVFASFIFSSHFRWQCCCEVVYVLIGRKRFTVCLDSFDYASDNRMKKKKKTNRRTDRAHARRDRAHPHKNFAHGNIQFQQNKWTVHGSYRPGYIFSKNVQHVYHLRVSFTHIQMSESIALYVVRFIFFFL